MPIYIRLNKRVFYRLLSRYITTNPLSYYDLYKLFKYVVQY